MRFNTLNQWLNWLETVHPTKIDLSLERCRTVAERLNLLSSAFPIITIAGTNGKGSSVMFLDSILSAAGYSIGRYTSPHLLRYNERICVNGDTATDADICQAFELIDKARAEISLTYFEFSTLAAVLIFQQYNVDLAILEVGLGGRLDAVNVFDAEIALVTAIDIDHVNWLGDNREAIGFEKAGIFRKQRPAVCSDSNPPQSLIDHAKNLQSPLYCINRDFSYPNHLPPPKLAGEYQKQNAAGVLMVLKLLKLPVSEAAIHQGLTTATLAGRFQILPGPITRILDVAHNPLGARKLAALLAEQDCKAKTHALIGMLKDKDIVQVLKILIDSIDEWHVTDLKAERAASSEFIAEQLQNLSVSAIKKYPSVNMAYKQILSNANQGDRIIVFGSFYTVAEVLEIEQAFSTASIRA
jgi:dihydrofolate synthase/folylpolyglutamate synthase